MIPIYQINEYLFVNLYCVSDLALSSPPFGRADHQVWTLTMHNGNKFMLSAEEASSLAAVIGSANQRQQQAQEGKAFQ